MNLITICLACISLTACKGLYQKPSPTMHYKAIRGEVFMMPCKNWSRVEKEIYNNDFAQFKAEVSHSGNYTCLTSTGWQFLHLEVVDNTLGCWSAKESRVTLKIGAGGYITCPGHNCSNSTNTVWYKGNMRVSELKKLKKRGLSFIAGCLLLHEVMEYDNAVFFCDQELSERGDNWTIRSSVTVEALYIDKYPPRILRPANDIVEEVEPGLSHTLKCVVDFPKADPTVIQWFMKDNGHLKNLTMEKIEEVKEVKWETRVIGKAIIEQVASQDLNKTYICIAQNTSGNVSSTIYLKKTHNIQWPSLIEYSLGSILFVSSLGIVVYLKWLEIQLILKSCWTFDKADVGHKDFDVFLSSVWSTTSVDMVSSPLRHNKDDGTFPFSLDPLELEVPSESLEQLLPHVLEDQWGYRLCLMDRDFLPGEAYTKDVVNAIQRSQMLICLLSAEYFSNNNAVFVLESGVQALLQNSGFKLQLIWTHRGPASLQQLDPPLPVVIQKALKVLPVLKFTSVTNTNFWRSLRKAMPHQRISSLQK
ncbi:interleukin-18 receptor accessory protein-like isoform X2 [Periophthalmus magnuspinnatus]|uniref:interleukin-18 receptor accessory protein-like isoform X2 n=1 Tax=Periophthalmus magnuspinnatus TaxID=409849 RepID=UPI002436622D|nr:interleukin-18 receptor accessory protein-like isoform X2 [Periophthalmus magnuspinnatus]